MEKLQRKVVAPKKQEFVGVDQEQKLTKVVIDDNRKTYLLKNVMPSGLFTFRDDNEKYVAIDGGREFEVTDTEIERLIETDPFVEGLVVFAKLYPEYDKVSNCMSDEKITQIAKLTPKKFEVAIQEIDSTHTFKRIKNILTSKNSPSSLYQLVELREAKIAEDFRKASEYVTDEERNKRNFAPSL